MKNTIKAIKAELKEINFPIYSRIKNNLREWGEGTMEEFLEESLIIFRRYDQGSLSFTVTALRHKGYGIHYSVLKAIAKIESKR